ncbi:MAG: hypothetical protein FRX49_12448 [Trebouxia sp. A1-2]|nr:MAG: hypothetical protein FRX49_12448 [Trebouxia sp. A1-2]
MGSIANGPSPFMSQPQNSVDMLGELPDIDFFSIPVDDFYEDYVTELGSRNSRKLSGALPSFGGANGFLPNSLPGTAPMAVEPTPAQSQQQPLLPQQPTDGFYPGPVVTSGQLGVPIQQPFQQGNLSGLNLGIGMPPIPSTSGQNGMYNSGSPGQNGSAGSDISFDDEAYGADHQQGNGSSRRPTSKLHARDTKTKRNPKQQMQNKQAQQRYRERRKQKFVEMEQAIDALAAQTKDMNTLQNQHHVLQGKTTQLEQMLKQKEMEIERLQQQLESKKSSGSSDSSVDVCATVELDEDPSAAYATEADRRHRHHEAEVQAYQHDWKQHVLRLKNYFERQGLQNVDPSGEGVDPAVMQEVAKMVAQSCSTCNKAMRAEGIKVMELMVRDMGQLTHIECSVKRAKWTQVLAVLQLSPTQQDQLMANRKEHLNKLRKVYQDRQELNMQAMGLMLPRCPENASQAKSSLEGKLDCMSLNGYSYTARENVDLNSTLDKIKCNLRKEQRTVMELNFVTMHRILSPLQCALFFVEAFPTHCDCLALANILAFQLHREDSFDRTGSGSQGHNDMSNSAGGSNGNDGNVDAQMDKAVQSVTHNGSGSLSHSSSK